MMKKFFLLLLVAVLMVSAVGCGGSNDEPAAEAPADAAETADTNGGEEADSPEEQELEGAVIIDGSGTVYPLMANIAEEYMVNEEPNVSVQVGRAGSSAGLKKFIPGELDFADSSRAIKDEEIQGLEENGFVYGEDILEFKLALDGLTMVINSDNDWAEEMTEEEVLSMYKAGAYRADDKVLWSDIRPEWPEEEIKFYGPNENHGTFEFFYEVLLEKQDLVKTADLQQEYSTLVDLVSNDKNAISFFGFGYYVTNQDIIKAVKIDFGNGPVAPALDTIGETLPYANFTRPVFTYLNAAYAKEKPQVLDYAKYVVSPEGAARLAGENGFAPLPAAEYQAYTDQLNNL